jgi:hypothetical protein
VVIKFFIIPPYDKENINCQNYKKILELLLNFLVKKSSNRRSTNNNFFIMDFLAGRKSLRGESFFRKGQLFPDIGCFWKHPMSLASALLFR